MRAEQRDRESGQGARVRENQKLLDLQGTRIEEIGHFAVAGIIIMQPVRGSNINSTGERRFRLVAYRTGSDSTALPCTVMRRSPSFTASAIA